MNQAFSSISPYQLSDNPFTLIDKDWLLITAGDMAQHNTMTASWGGVGIIWNKPVATVYIRPQRYTKQFVDHCEYFTLSALPSEMRDVLTYCGRMSGKDVDKDKECGLTPFLCDENNPQSVGYEQAKLILVCRKLYAQTLTEESFIYPEIAQKNYPTKDYHEMYIAEIVDVLVK